MNVRGLVASKTRAMRQKKFWARNEKLRATLDNKALRVGLVSADEFVGKVTDDLLLQEAFLKSGVNASLISWRDNDVDYRDFDALLVTSMWGYQNHLEDLNDFFKDVKKSGVKIFNSLDIIQANYDKVKQLKILDKSRVSHIETFATKIWDEDTEEKAMKKFDLPFVVKPSISGSGEGATLINDESDLAKVRGKLAKIAKEKALLVQPFVPEIRDGELAVILVGGKIVSVVRRFPGVFQGKFHVQVEGVEYLDYELEQVVKKVKSIPEYEDALYVRIDLVKVGNEYKVMELEYFEPQLFYYLLEGEEREAMLSAMVDGVKKRATRRH